MRLFTLYLRSRRIPVALAATAAGVALVALLGNAPDPWRTRVFAVLALGLGLGVLGNGLGGAADTLERTGAIRWAGWRTAHLVAMTGAVLAVVTAASEAPTGVLLRAAAGLAGLTALAAVVLGHQLAWTLPTVWAGAAAVVPPVTEPELLRLLTWPMQPSDSTAAALAAGVPAVGGLILYATRGSRPSALERRRASSSPSSSRWS
ncbi:hypothetical protein KEF29_21070 [Streptomyces tuirus]|uniref:Uncharacterized protein n=1 Tax=Streptomyces tuirus TaxID=68278 RepID=A0A941FIM7_9ACTN|nr:hypothetical protein [Streptomyces tuirus]